MERRAGRQEGRGGRIMMRDVLIYLCAAVLCVPIAKRLGLGSVLGYLVAGVAIGPYGLAFVEDVESIRQFSEFGVVLMLFLIGLELEPHRLKSMRREVFGGGLAQFALSGLALGVAAYFAGLGWKVALLVGLALGMSSTAIVVPAMTERNFLATPTGRAGFAILLFQDVASIPLLAAIPLLAHTEAHGTPIWMEALKAFGAIAGVIVIGRYLTRPALRLVARTELRELFTAFSLLLVIGIAYLMQLADLSMAMGAFLAGVLLANSEYRHALETDIEPFKGLLLGLFFIAVGMSINLSLLRIDPAKVALLLGGFLVLKIATLWLTARLVGINRRQRWLFSILLSQGDEFAFVIFGAAGAARLLSAETVSGLTMTVALSMATTPLLLLLHDRVMSRKVIAEEQADTIDEPAGEVIIAGFGRFGQIVGRLLFAHGVRAIVLDHDPDQIEMLRKFGYKVFYGDATRLDLLQAAGASDAALLVNAIDDVEDSLALTDLAAANFPQLQIVARARNVSHYIELRTRGVNLVERETFESALRLGRHTLEALGVDPYRAIEIANNFRRHNLNTMDALIPHFRDELKVLTAAKAGREELERQFAQDREKFEENRAESWSEPTVRDPG
jgi:glutathione-regulated potassium-efflux system ancillary protein KefC